jgi:hypothetical protein
MREAFPHRASKIIHRIQEVRGGALNDSVFFSRHHGSGTYWRFIEKMFDIGYRRAGFSSEESPVPHTFRRPQAQQSLF